MPLHRIIIQRRADSYLQESLAVTLPEEIVCQSPHPESGKPLNRFRISSVAMAIGLAVLAGGCQRTQTGPGVVDPDAPTEFTTTDSGLQYRIVRKGSGARPSGSNTVVVDYAGRLEDGRLFDTTYNGSEPATFPLSSVVPGWAEGMQLVREGGMIELRIPPELGYGAAGNAPSIPPNATLVFKVELLEIK